MTATIERHRERSLSELPLKYREITEGGADFTNYGYRDKFAARKAVLVAAVRRGWTFSDCQRVFLSDPASPAWDLWASSRSEIGPQGRLKRLREDFRQASALVASTPAPTTSAVEVRAVIGEIIAESANADFRGRTARVDRDVLRAVHTTGTRYGSLSVMLPVRDLGLMSGVSDTTVSRSLRRLVKAGWLRPAPKIGLTHVYIILRPVKVFRNDAYHRQELSYSDMRHRGTPDPSHETWVMLGKAAMAAWSVLDNEPRSCREISRLAGIGPGTSLRVLRILADCALAIRNEDDKTWTLGKADPDTVAREHGFNTVARRKSLYEVQRAGWDNWAQQSDIDAGSPIARKSHDAAPLKPRLKSVYVPVAVPSKGINWKDEFELTGPWADAAA